MLRRILPAAVLIVLTLLAVLGLTTGSQRERQYQALLAQGDAALRDEQTFGAIEAFSGAIALQPDSMLAHLRRGETYRRRGDLEAALRDLRTASRLDPTAPRPVEELADVQFALQRWGGAAESYAAVVRLDDRSARAFYKLAIARYRDGNTVAAIPPLRQAVGIDDQFADAHYLLGLCLLERGRTSEAQASLERAVQLVPSMVPARDLLADLYSRQGRRAEELEQLQLLAAIERDRPERHVALGLAHAQTGHADLAVLTLGSAAARFPERPAIYAALGRVWLEIAESRKDRVALNKAIEALRDIATRPSATSELLGLYGRALLAAGHDAEAALALQTAAARFPIDRAALLSLATAREHLGQWAEARQALLALDALSTDTTDAAARAERIAIISLRLNDVSAGVSWFGRAVDRAGADARLLGLLAEAQLRAGDAASARETLNRALVADPRQPALQALARRLK